MPHPSHPPRRLTSPLLVGLVTLALAILVGGCGGGATGGDDAGGASASPSASSATPASPAPSGETTTAAPSSPSSGPSAAAGPAMTFSSLAIHLPTGWQVQATDPASGNGFDPSLDHGQGQLIVYDSSGFDFDTIDSQAKQALRTAQRSDLKPVRQANRTVGGVEGYVLTGGSTSYPTYYEFGTVTHDHDINVIIQFGGRLPATESTAVVESILASITWT